MATGENLDDISEFTPLIANEAVDIVQVGWGTSGITGALQIADLAYAFDLPVSIMNCPGNFMAHVAAALPNYIMMEVIAAGRATGMGMIADNYIEDGWIVLSDAPGLGMAYDEAQLDELAQRTWPVEANAGRWGRRRGAGLYEFGPEEPDDAGEG